MSRKSILEAKQKAKETNELLEYLTDLIEKNDKRIFVCLWGWWSRKGNYGDF